MAYPGIDWKNKPNHTSPLNAVNLEIMDNELVYLDEAMTVANQDIENWGRLDGVSVVSGNLLPGAIEKGKGGYYYSTNTSQITRLDTPQYTNAYQYAIIPLSETGMYCANHPMRWWISVDENNAHISHGEQSVAGGINVGSGAKKLYVTWKQEFSDMGVYKGGLVPSDTKSVFLLPETVEMPSVNQIEARLNDFVEKNGEKQVQSPNIFGMTEGSGKSISPYNEFSNDLLYLEGKYPVVNTTLGTVSFYTNANLNTYRLKVDGVSTYNFTYCRTAVLTLADQSTTVGDTMSYATEIDSTGGGYIFFAFNPNEYSPSTYEIKRMLQNYNIPPNWVLPEATQTDISQKIYGKGFATVKGNMASGNSFTIYENNVKKNNVYSFMGHITSFSSILIGHGKNTYDGSWIEINSTKVILHNYLTSDSVTEYTHGLTIADYIYVQIIVGIAQAKIIIFSNKNKYEINDAAWTGDGGGVAFAESSGSALTDCIFTWSCKDFRKSVWMFGDSYFGMTNDSRWVYNMVQAGYSDNVLLNAYPGEATGKAITSLDNLIQYFGKPKFIVWCLGMNDGSDTDINTPSTTWMNGVNHVIDLCETYGITPIFATIPTVPTIYHEGKDKWVRESGYRYIDFAKAVGAQSDGTWYPSMLSGDGVHPWPAGAYALYNQAIADCPEITFESP